MLLDKTAEKPQRRPAAQGIAGHKAQKNTIVLAKRRHVLLKIFNQGAFTSPDAFNYYYGNGPRISEYRKSGYRNQDLSLIKNTRLFKDVNLQLRLEAFNVWNWHNWNGGSTQWGGNAFQTDIAASDFGMWNGSVTAPRVIQLAARFEF